VEQPAQGFPAPNPSMYADPASLNEGLRKMSLVPA